jgi:hypothetical protein
MHWSPCKTFVETFLHTDIIWTIAAITAFKATQVAHWICAQMHAHELDCIKKLRSIPELAHEVSMARIATNAAPIGK